MKIRKFLFNFFGSFGGEDDYQAPEPAPDHKAASLEVQAAVNEAHRLQEEEKEELKQFARLIGRTCKSQHKSTSGAIINGASGLPMIGGSGGVDAAGNSFGSRHRGIGDI